MEVKNYLPRIVDQELDEMLQTIGAILITGPKQCGKTTTALRHVKTYYDFNDPNSRDYYKINKEQVYQEETPILFDEWQECDGVWDDTRRFIDQMRGKGMVILTGSINEKGEKSHTRTGRIAELKMDPMTLFESGESNGLISLKEMFIDPEKAFTPSKSNLSMENLIHALCRGGWPSSIIETNEQYKLKYVDYIYENICSSDVTRVDGVNRNKDWVENIIKTYAQNICTPAKMENIYHIVAESSGNKLSRSTFYRYVNVLKNLYIIDEIKAWTPNIRSTKSMISHKKINLIDPSLAVSALGVNPTYFKHDMRTLGLLFESLCIRDLRVYASPLKGKLSYFRTRSGLECDLVIHLRNGDYALIECKLTEEGIKQGAKSLNEIEKSILEHDRDEKTYVRYGKPKFKAIITGSGFMYQREDGIYVIPITCLKD